MQFHRDGRWNMQLTLNEVMNSVPFLLSQAPLRLFALIASKWMRKAADPWRTA